MALNLEQYIKKPVYTLQGYTNQVIDLLPLGSLWDVPFMVAALGAQILQDVVNSTGYNNLQDSVQYGAFDTIEDSTSSNSGNGGVAGSLFGRLLSCFAGELERANADFTQAYNERVPGLSYALLGDWENELGLPDACTPEGTEQTIEERRETAHLKYYGEYEASTVQYLTNLGNSLGFDISITEGDAGVLSFIMGVAVMGNNKLGGSGTYAVLIITVQPGGTGDVNELQCRINKDKPAHCVTVWNFLT